MSHIFTKEQVVQFKHGAVIRPHRYAAGQRLRTTREEARLVVGLFDYVPHDPAGKHQGKRRSRNRSSRQKLRKGCFVSGLTKYLGGAFSVVEYENFSSEVKVLGYWKTKIARLLKEIGDARFVSTACRELGWKPDYPWQIDSVRSFKVGRNILRSVHIYPRPEGYRARLWPIEFSEEAKASSSNDVEEDVASTPNKQDQSPHLWCFDPGWNISADPFSSRPFRRSDATMELSYGLAVEVCENGDFIVSLPRRLPGRRWIFRALFPELGFWVLDKFLRDMGFVPGDHESERLPGMAVFRWRPDYSAEQPARDLLDFADWAADGLEYFPNLGGFRPVFGRKPFDVEEFPSSWY